MERQVKIAISVIQGDLEKAFPDCTFMLTCKQYLHNTVGVLVETVPMERFTDEFIAYGIIQKNRNLMAWSKYNARLNRTADVHTREYAELITKIKKALQESASYSKSGVLVFLQNSIHREGYVWYSIADWCIC